MSFTEQQIRFFIHQELKRILETGLMYTESCKPVERQGAPPSSHESPVTPAPQSPPNILSKLPQEISKHLTLQADGTIKSEYVSLERFKQINEALKKEGYTRVGQGKDAYYAKQ